MKLSEFTKDILTISIICSILFGTFLGKRSLSAPDEGRYSEIPREMVVSGDYITPRLNGIKYFEKPPLMYWLTAISIKIFGIKEWALRFWTMFFAVLGCLATYAFARNFYNRSTAFFSATILATTLLYYALSRVLILDMVVSVCISISLFFLGFYTFAKNRQIPKYTIYGFFIFAALAMLTKGLISVILPGLIIVIWSLCAKKTMLIKNAFHFGGIILFLMLSVPWHILVQLKNPEFFQFYFVHEQITRFLTTVHHRYQPWWFFIPILFLGIFPWGTFILKALQDGYRAVCTIIKNRKLPSANSSKENVESFLMIWIVTMFTFYSYSNSKLITYILPIFPPIAILISKHIANFWNNKEKLNLYKKELIGLQITNIILIGIIATLVYIENYVIYTNVKIVISFILLIFIISTGLIQYYRRKNNNKFIVYSIFLLAIGFMSPLNIPWTNIEGRSIYQLVQKIDSLRKNKDIVISYGQYYQDLAPYLGQIVKIFGWVDELSFGDKHQTTNNIIYDKDKIKEILNNKSQNVFIVTHKEMLKSIQQDYHAYNLKLIAKNNRDILLIKEKNNGF